MNENDLKEMAKETVAIDVPPREGTILSVVFTWDQDMRSYFPYLYPNGHGPDAPQDDWGHTVEWYVEQVERAETAIGFLKLPQQAHRDWWVYIPVEYLKTKLKHIHLAWTESPLAKRNMAGERILVPMPQHGPGKRGRN